MKQKFLSILVCILLLIATVSTAAAHTLPRVVDNADLLTADEEALLQEKAESFWDSCQLDVVIVTVESTGGESLVTFADDFYDVNGYGYGSDYSGILLLIDMDTREWYISTCGEAIHIFTDYGLDQMGERMLDELSSGDFYGAFDTWLDLIPEYYLQYQNGTPIDNYGIGSDGPNPLGSIWLAILVGAVIAGVAILVMRGQMNTARAQSGASEYMKKGSFNLHTQRDLFLYSRVTKTPRPKESSGGGSSVHVSSSGRSHGGRGGKF